MNNFRMFIMDPPILSSHFEFTMTVHSYSGVKGSTAYLKLQTKRGHQFCVGVCDPDHPIEITGERVSFGIPKGQGWGWSNESNTFYFPNKNKIWKYGLWTFKDYVWSDSEVKTITVAVDKKKQRFEVFRNGKSIRMFEKVEFPEYLHIAISPKKEIDIELTDFKDYDIPEQILEGKQKHVEEEEEEEVLGEGAFGVVRSDRYFVDVKCATKKIKLKRGVALKDVQNEFKAQVCLRHRNVVRVFSYEQISKDTVEIKMEKMKCNLMEYFKYNTLSIAKKLDFMKQMTRAVHYLHHETTPPIIHRDIKALNFLVSEDEDTIKISDFGLVREKVSLDSKLLTERQVGSVFWMAPEILRPEILIQDPRNEPKKQPVEKKIPRAETDDLFVSLEEPEPSEKEGEGEEEEEEEIRTVVVYSFASDVYALGMTFYELLYERAPFNEKEEILRYHVAMKNLRPKFKNPRVPEGCLIRLRRLIKSMWRKNRKERPDTQTILKWFEENERKLVDEFGGRIFPSEFLMK